MHFPHEPSGNPNIYLGSHLVHVGSMWEIRLHFPVAETQAPPQAGRAGRRILRLRWWRGTGNSSLRSRGACEQGMRGTTPFDAPTFSCGRKQGPAAGGARRTENSDVEGVGVRRKSEFTLAGVARGVGESRGSSPALPSPVYPYDAPAGAQCAECTQPVLFKYDAESSIGAV